MNSRPKSRQTPKFRQFLPPGKQTAPSFQGPKVPPCFASVESWIVPSSHPNFPPPGKCQENAATWPSFPQLSRVNMVRFFRTFRQSLFSSHPISCRKCPSNMPKYRKYGQISLNFSQDWRPKYGQISLNFSQDFVPAARRAGWACRYSPLVTDRSIPDKTAQDA